jgi:hypothetical protein
VSLKSAYKTPAPSVQDEIPQPSEKVSIDFSREAEPAVAEAVAAAEQADIAKMALARQLETLRQSEELGRA